MANPQNLKPKPWPKGVSGNPKGRPPKGAAFADLIALIDETPGGRRALSKTWFKEMLKGNFQFFREYLERSDGKIPNAEPANDVDEDLDTNILIRIPKPPKPKPSKPKPKKNGKA